MFNLYVKFLVEQYGYDNSYLNMLTEDDLLTVINLDEFAIWCEIESQPKVIPSISDIQFMLNSIEKFTLLMLSGEPTKFAM